MKMKAKVEPPLHRGLGHAAAQPSARVPSWALFAVTKSKVNPGTKCVHSASPSQYNRHIADMSVYPKWLNSEASLSQQTELDYSDR